MGDEREEVNRQHLKTMIHKESDIRTLHGEVATLKTRMAQQTEEHGVVYSFLMQFD